MATLRLTPPKRVRSLPAAPRAALPAATAGSGSGRDRIDAAHPSAYRPRMRAAKAYPMPVELRLRSEAERERVVP
jgi:hypothetical protein